MVLCGPRQDGLHGKLNPRVVFKPHETHHTVRTRLPAIACRRQSHLATLVFPVMSDCLVPGRERMLLSSHFIFLDLQ